MNDGFKQRLVGAIVLVSLALIVWPVIFSEGINSAVDRHSQISAPPLFEKFPVPEPDRPAGLEPIVTPSNETSKSLETADREIVEKVTPPVIEKQPRLDAKGLPESWVLQVASFAQPNNAEELTEALIKLGYKAYTRTIQSSEGASTRVYVGPRFTKASFKTDQQAIDKRFSVSSMLIRFEQ